MYHAEAVHGLALLQVDVDRIEGCDRYGVWVWRTTSTESQRLVWDQATEEFSWVDQPELEPAPPVFQLPGRIAALLVRALKQDPSHDEREKLVAEALVDSLDWGVV